MFYLLFIIYFSLAVGCLLRMGFVKNSQLSKGTIAGLFSLKILAAIALGWISQHYYPNNDYWGLNKEGAIEHQLLLNDPGEFFKSLFRSPYQDSYAGFFNSIGSFWNDIRDNIVIKIIALLHFISGGNYYINSLLLNTIGFLGHIALFRVFIHLYPKKKWHIIIGCFLLPSTLYFSSGIHKDLIVFTMLGFYCYALYFLVVQKSCYKKWAVLLLSFGSLLLMRNFVAIALLPATVAFLISIKTQWRFWVPYLMVYISIVAIVFLLEKAVPSFLPLKVITQKQSDFLDLPEAASQLRVTRLEPNTASFISHFPRAVNHGFLRPYPCEPAGRFSLFLSIEMMAYLIIVALALFSSYKNNTHPTSFLFFATCFSLSLILLTGYIIPNSSSIVRYKSLYLPLLITPALICISGLRKKHINI